MRSFDGVLRGRTALFAVVVTRLRAGIGVLLLGCAGLSFAQAPPVLTLDEAVRLGLNAQPQVEAPLATARAARETAVAERQLPDPKVMVGLSDVPVEAEDAFSLNRDFMTQTMVGVTQDFPRARTRQLRGARAELQAEAAEAMAAQSRSEVRRDVALAWLEALGAEQAQRLAQADRETSARALAAVEIALRASKATQAEVLAARMAEAMAADRIEMLAFAGQQARAMLSRWIGQEAYRPLPAELPALPTVPALEAVLNTASNHPHLNALAIEVAAAENGMALAKDDYRPAWSVDVYYAYRPDFPDMVGARVMVGLPLFAGQRQDRRLAASRALRDEAQAKRDDALRMQTAQVHELWAEHHQLQERLRRFDAVILPAAEQRVQAAEAAYAAGEGRLDAIYDGRRAALDAQLTRLQLAVSLARAQVRFQYFSE